jgi:hypothetical protein
MEINVERKIIICPNCKKKYIPELERKTDKPTQVEFPNEPRWKREQLITGLCSNKCWNKFVGMKN